MKLFKRKTPYKSIANVSETRNSGFYSNSSLSLAKHQPIVLQKYCHLDSWFPPRDTTGLGLSTRSCRVCQATKVKGATKPKGSEMLLSTDKMLLCVGGRGLRHMSKVSVRFHVPFHIKHTLGRQLITSVGK